MKLYVPDAKFVMMLVISLVVITVAANAAGYGTKVKQYLGIG